MHWLNKLIDDYWTTNRLIITSLKTVSLWVQLLCTQRKTSKDSTKLRMSCSLFHKITNVFGNDMFYKVFYFIKGHRLSRFLRYFPADCKEWCESCWNTWGPVILNKFTGLENWHSFVLRTRVLLSQHEESTCVYKSDLIFRCLSVSVRVLRLSWHWYLWPEGWPTVRIPTQDFDPLTGTCDGDIFLLPFRHFMNFFFLYRWRLSYTIFQHFEKDTGFHLHDTQPSFSRW